MRPLARIAMAKIHSPDPEAKELRTGCDTVQDAVQVQFETLLNDAAKECTENVRKALAKDRTLVRPCGMDNRTLAWVAMYRNRPRILDLTLKTGADYHRAIAVCHGPDESSPSCPALRHFFKAHSRSRLQ